MNSALPNSAQTLSNEVLALLRRAMVCLEHGDFALAIELLEAGLTLAPDHPELLRRQAVVLHMQERFQEAASVLQHIIRIYPNDAKAHNNLGSALGAAGDMLDAVAALRCACELAPSQANYWYNLAKALEGIADAGEACMALTRFLELEPEDAEARILRADSLKTLGRIEEAEVDLRYVLARHPDAIEAWAPLVNLKSIHLSGQDLAEIKRVYMRSDTSADYRTSLGFAYGMALEASHRYAEAFPVLVEANTAKRKRIQWDASVTSRLVDDTIKAFSQPLSPTSESMRGKEVILLFGMPRSGSTLLEQILCAHPQVEGAGEIGDLDIVLFEESKRRGTDISQWAPTASTEDWARLGNAYLERTMHWRQQRPIFTDKALGKWQFVGAARAMLPGACFIYCRRDPLETCWSCFKHEFKNDQFYSYDFCELATYWKDCERLVRFWRTQYSGLIYDFAYEDLIEQPEIQIRRLLDHCGLPFDPRCLRFHEVERSVRTASAGQVRRPLNRDTAVSACYGALLNPLREALGLPAVSN